MIINKGNRQTDTNVSYLFSLASKHVNMRGAHLKQADVVIATSGSLERGVTRIHIAEHLRVEEREAQSVSMGDMSVYCIACAKCETVVCEEQE